jgi:outer membrane protein TolC
VVLAAARFPGPAAAQSDSVRGVSLEEALTLARPASEAVAIAKVGIDRARGDVTKAKSQLFPQLNGSLRYTRQIKSQFDNLLNSSTPVDTTAPTSCPAFHPDPNKPFDQRIGDLETAVTCATTVNPFAGFSRLPFGRKNTYTLGLTGSQTLFDGGSIFGQMKAADAGKRSAEVGLTAAEAQLTLDVVQAYYDAALSDRLVAIAEATLAQADTTFTQTRLRHDVGTAPEFDVLRASVARDNQVPVTLTARTQRDLAYTRLKQLLNLPVETSLTLTTELADTATGRVPTLARLASIAPDTTATHRAPVRQAAEAIRAQEGLAQATRSQRLPSLALTSSYSRLAYPASGLPDWNEFLTDWNVALGISVPIFTGGRLKGDRMVAKASLEEAKLRHRQTLKAAQLDSRNAIDQLQSAVANWRASEGTATQANRAYQIADIRFREGISTQTELLDARIALQQAEVNRAQAARDLQIARVRVGLLPDLPLPGASAAAPTTPTTTPTPVRQPVPTTATTTTTNPTGQLQ